MLYCRCQLNFTFNFRCVNQFELKGTIITCYWQTICQMFFVVNVVVFDLLVLLLLLFMYLFFTRWYL